MRAAAATAAAHLSPRLAARRAAALRPARRSSSSRPGARAFSGADDDPRRETTPAPRADAARDPFPRSWPRAMGTIVDEKVAYKRYLAVFDREVEFPPAAPDAGSSDGGPPGGALLPRRVRYDIVGHPRSDFRFAVVFPFHPATADRPAEVTLIREYCQASNALGLSLPTGSFDPGKHASLADTATRELAEEARLRDARGAMECLLADENHPGFVESKWCANRFKPYLCVDPEPIDPEEAPRRDAEEFSIETERVGIDRLERLMYEGGMMLPSIVASQMALDALRRRGAIPPRNERA